MIWIIRQGLLLLLLVLVWVVERQLVILVTVVTFVMSMTVDTIDF